MAGLTELLATYPTWTIERVISPRNGIPAKFGMMPSIAEVRTFCDDLVAEETRHRELIERNSRPRLPAPEIDRTGWPSMEELKAKYGPGWGLQGAETKPQERQWLTGAELRKLVGDEAFDRVPDARNSWKQVG